MPFLQWTRYNDPHWSMIRCKPSRGSLDFRVLFVNCIRYIERNRLSVSAALNCYFFFFSFLQLWFFAWINWRDRTFFNFYNFIFEISFIYFSCRINKKIVTRRFLWKLEFKVRMNYWMITEWKLKEIVWDIVLRRKCYKNTDIYNNLQF